MYSIMNLRCFNWCMTSVKWSLHCWHGSYYMNMRLLFNFRLFNNGKLCSTLISICRICFCQTIEKSMMIFHWFNLHWLWIRVCFMYLGFGHTESNLSHWQQIEAGEFWTWKFDVLLHDVIIRLLPWHEELIFFFNNGFQAWSYWFLYKSIISRNLSTAHMA